MAVRLDTLRQQASQFLAATPGQNFTRGLGTGCSRPVSLSRMPSVSGRLQLGRIADSFESDGYRRERDVPSRPDRGPIQADRRFSGRGREWPCWKRCTARVDRIRRSKQPWGISGALESSLATRRGHPAQAANFSGSHEDALLADLEARANFPAVHCVLLGRNL